MTDARKVFRLMEQAAARARGETPEAPDDLADGEPPPRSEGVRYAWDRLEEAANFAAAGTTLPPDARMKPVKQAMLSFVRPVTSHQVPFNGQVLGAIEGLAGEAERLTADLGRQEQRALRLQAGIATTDLTVDDLNDSVKQLTTEIDDLAGALQTVISSVSDLRATVERLHGSLQSDVQIVRAKQDLVFRAARQALPGEFDLAQLGALSRELATGYEELYEDLEDTFRGSREHILKLAEVYVDDVRSVRGHSPVIDVGCGRGEWLEVLRDADIEGYGVDINEVVVERGQARGLDVRHEDALVHLRGLPEGSVRAVTSFHVVEHLSLDMLIQLIDAALVALKPGGLLIFETPNPTNVNVGASSFYIDPTHLKPLHPQFCEFLVLSRGFVEADVRYLHPEEGPRLVPADLAIDDPERAGAVVDRINWAMFGPLDYAVVARKAGAPEPSADGDREPA